LLQQPVEQYQLPLLNWNDEPLYPNMTLNDMIIHFHCGDVLSSGHPSYGYLKFAAFTKHISPHARSIGIMTQAFDVSCHDQNSCTLDAHPKNCEHCCIVITKFVTHLQQHFPSAVVQIHNHPNESIALQYACMIMANQMFAVILMFGLFTAIASFGTGYFQSSDQMLYHINAKYPNDFVIMEEMIILSSGKI